MREGVGCTEAVFVELKLVTLAPTYTPLHPQVSDYPGHQRVLPWLTYAPNRLVLHDIIAAVRASRLGAAI